MIDMASANDVCDCLRWTENVKREAEIIEGRKNALKEIDSNEFEYDDFVYFTQQIDDMLKMICPCLDRLERNLSILLGDKLADESKQACRNKRRRELRAKKKKAVKKEALK